jgi:hypothetical protein
MGNPLIDDLEKFRNRALHWRDAHFDCARLYQRLDNLLGIPAVVLATTILGFAFYAVDRPSAPVWAQYALAGLAIAQAIIAAIQAYVRPGAKAEAYRTSAANFASVYRRWESLMVAAKSDVAVSIEQVRDIQDLADRVARDAPEVPQRIFIQHGLPPR